MPGPRWQSAERRNTMRSSIYRQCGDGYAKSGLRSGTCYSAMRMPQGGCWPLPTRRLSCIKAAFPW